MKESLQLNEVPWFISMSNQWFLSERVISLEVDVRFTVKDVESNCRGRPTPRVVAASPDAADIDTTWGKGSRGPQCPHHEPDSDEPSAHEL